MDSIRHGRPNPRPLHALIVVEGSPLRSLIDEILVDYKSAIGANKFRTFVVSHQCMALTLRTLDREFLELVYLLLLTLEPGPLFQLLRLRPLYLSQLLNLFDLLSLPDDSSI